ncbi:MAG: hypothetical protein M0D53_02205 [Flavobacterium sp. JAD_PAG50586_2]|nr:MAG: hypothetical protein M0D53_02205 [Flavobacterium sp. JAD_PAG50586_2]
MELNWYIIGAVILFAIILLVYLIRRNLKDEKEVIEHFNEQSATFPDDEPEANDPQ